MDHRTRPDPLRAGVAIRQRLYLASALVALVGAVVEGGAAWVGLVVVFCAGAVVGWLRLGSTRRRVVAMFGFEQLAGIWLAAAGFPLAGFAVALGSVIATSLTLPAEPAVRWVGAVAAGLIGVLEVPGTGVATVFRVGAVIALTWGLAVLFRVVGFEIEHHHRLLSEWPRRQRRLMDAAPEPMVIYRKGEILYANPAAARIVEVDSPEDLIGRHVLEFIDPDDEPLAVERMARVAAGESLEPAHLRVRTVNGNLRHVETTAYRTDWEGEVAVHLVLRDRTEVEQTRAELAALFHRLPVALYRSTPEGEVIAGNPALAELLGYPDVEALLNDGAGGQPGLPGSWPDGEFWRDLMDREGTVLGFEQEMVRWDGSRIWVSDSAVAVRDDRGEIAYYEGAMVDITDRIRVEKSRRRLLDIVEATSELIGLCDRSGTLIYANPALRRFLWGNTVGPFRPIHVARILGADTVRAVEDTLRRNGRWQGEAVIRLESGERVVSGSVLVHGRARTSSCRWWDET
ncbi:MAG: hypothetical protein KatS3mg011_1895 [Acidimicrobiia bacterium]|nr:MAG: hypothetical protein KatS3mg011_1895 [Acidimicrobiia bacterium]